VGDAPTARRRARDAAGALDSPFRRRWTWRRRTSVVVVGTLLGWVLRLLYATLRVRWTDPGDVVGRRERGERFLFAVWHDNLCLLPLVVLRVPGRYRPRVLLSWSRDAEIAAQAARRFGVSVMRGSSTRGGPGAVRGLLAAHAAGEDVLMVPDGPKGPRRQAKPGVVQLARATGARVVPLALAAAPVRRLGSWDRMAVPMPFARVALRAGEPIEVGDDVEGARLRLEASLAAANDAVERDLVAADA
jgi:lysophospholipid acyltransferase (LPLAT)-like uncharacterized protein